MHLKKLHLKGIFVCGNCCISQEKSLSKTVGGGWYQTIKVEMEASKDDILFWFP